MGVVYLGADVPLDSWSHALDVIGAVGVVIGIPTPRDRSAARDVVEEVAERRGLLVAVGGPAAPDAKLPDSVLRLPEPIGSAATTLEAVLARRST